MEEMRGGEGLRLIIDILPGLLQIQWRDKEGLSGVVQCVRGQVERVRDAAGTVPGEGARLPDRIRWQSVEHKCT